MSASHIALVWTLTEPRGVERLVLLAIADCANHSGVAEASVRTLAGMAGVDKTTVTDVVSGLCDAGFIRLVSASNGRIPARYQIVERATGRVVSGAAEGGAEIFVSEEIRPDTNPVFDAPKQAADENPPAPPKARQEPSSSPAPGSAPGLTNEDVIKVLSAAGVFPDPSAPLFWARREHRQDLATVLTQTGLNVPRLCLELREAVAAGRKLDRPPKRIIEVSKLLQRGGRV